MYISSKSNGQKICYFHHQFGHEKADHSSRQKGYVFCYPYPHSLHYLNLLQNRGHMKEFLQKRKRTELTFSLLQPKSWLRKPTVSRLVTWIQFDAFNYSQCISLSSFFTDFHVPMQNFSLSLNLQQKQPLSSMYFKLATYQFHLVSPSTFIRAPDPSIP